MAATLSDIVGSLGYPIIEEVISDAKMIYEPRTFELQYHFIQGHRDFLQKVLVNNYDRTPLTDEVTDIIQNCLTQGYYTESQRQLFINLRTKYKDHVWGTHL